MNTDLSPSADLHSITGVPVFRAGTWNGDAYGVDDLDAMVSAANEVTFGVPIKAGHTEEAGKPALGWVENLRRQGETLFADLVALPKKVYDAIKSRGYDAVSAEIYWDLERNGKTYPRVLKALALLGAEIPAVDLTPLHAFLSSMAALPAGRIAVYAVTLKDEKPAKEHEMDGGMEPDEKGECPPGHEKGEDGKCRPVAGYSDDKGDDMDKKKGAAEMAEDTQVVTHDVKPGEIVVSLAQLETLKRQAAKAERLETLEKDLEKVQAEYAEVEARRREESISFRLRNVRIPAFRAHIRALYEIAALAPTVKTFALADPKKPVVAEAVVDALVAEMNKQAEVLFSQISVDSKHRVNPDEPEETQAKIEFRVKEFCRANKMDPTKDYKQALQAVLSADPELAEAYRQS